MTLCILIHDDRLIHKVKYSHCLGAADVCCVSLVSHYARITTIYLCLSMLCLKHLYGHLCWQSDYTVSEKSLPLLFW